MAKVPPGLSNQPDLKKDRPSPPAPPYLILVLTPKKLTTVLVLVVSCLIAAHVTSQYLKFFHDHDSQLGFARLLNLDRENNIPTWYSSSALLLSAILLAVIGLSNKREGNLYAFHWLGLAAIFLYLSLDEAAGLHEQMGILLKPMQEATGYIHGVFLYDPWLIVGVMFVLIVALSYLRFLAALSVKIRSLFLLAGTLYIGGALGTETLGNRRVYLDGYEDFTYAMFVACEEGLEMLGVVVFIYALLSHLGASVHTARI